MRAEWSSIAAASSTRSTAQQHPVCIYRRRQRSVPNQRPLRPGVAATTTRYVIN